MHLLAIESSSPVLTVALQAKGHPIKEKEISGFSNHVENLVPAIRDLLSEAGLEVASVTDFLIGRGPGSFTGLRVGFATLKALQLLQKKNCFGVLSLDLIAENMDGAKEGQTLAVGLNAHRDHFYFRLYTRLEGAWVATTEPAVSSLEEVVQAVPEQSWFTGDALKLTPEKWREAFQSKKIRMAEETFWYPRASKAIALFNLRPQLVQPLTAPADFVPLYFRLSEAEERKNARL